MLRYSFNIPRPLLWLGCILLTRQPESVLSIVGAVLLYTIPGNNAGVIDLNMVNAGQVANIMAVKNHFTCQLFHVFLDLVVLDHDDHQIHSCEEIV